MTSHAPTGIVRAAVVQAAPVLFDTPRTLDKFADLAAEAARQQAELVVFPEAFVGGYPKGHDFRVSVGIRTPEGRDDFSTLLRERHRHTRAGDRADRPRRPEVRRSSRGRRH